MPWGIQRLNVKKTQPNPNIVFIKPLPGSDENVAQDFLERIAAQCLPIMREHHLYVMTLEEFEPNREFVGRNFNAGEVIQLVLKSPGTGRWLPFEYVQMVMMHELAHCKQMNHSRAFWAIRNQYASHMHGLWSKGYSGEGFWGRGAKLGTGEWEKNTVRPDEILPEHLCGGTFRSRRRKRKAKPVISYQERKERRILKKFGKNGVALGTDDEAKVKLEKGKRVQAKPRVAGSARGRELRAAAALARFEQQKTSEEPTVKDEDRESSSDSDYDDTGEQDLDAHDAIDVDGKRLIDGKGRGMVKVCEDEEADDPGAAAESDQLRSMLRKVVKEEPVEVSLLSELDAATAPQGSFKAEPDDGNTLDDTVRKPSESQEDSSDKSVPSSKGGASASTTVRRLGSQSRQGMAATTTARRSSSDLIPCALCSFANPKQAVTCNVCANVLDPLADKAAWRCSGSPCRESLYLNSADSGACGLCGKSRAADL